MKVLTKIVKFIIITILTICLIASGIITIVSSTILDQQYIMQKLEETNFYSETYELVKSNFENYIYQSGLNEEVLQNICPEEKIKEDINTIISNIYSGTNIEVDTSEIEKKLNENIEKSGIKNNKNEKAIEQFVTHICNEYTDTIIHTKYENTINKQYVKIAELLAKVYNAVAIVLVIDIIILIIMNRKKSSKNLQDWSTALIATGIFNAVTCSIITSKVNIYGIKIFNDTFSKTIVSIIEEIIVKAISLGIGMIVIALILMLIYAIIIFKSKKENEREKQTTDK